MLHRVNVSFGIPLLECVVFVEVNSSILLVNGWDVDFCSKPHLRGLIRVVLPADDGEHVDAVVEVCVRWPNDGSVPVGERLVIALV